MEGNGTESGSEISVDSKELWSQVGFHRPLAGFWYNLSIWIVQIFFGIFVGTLIFQLLYPFPESMGYRNAGTAMFSVMFQIFDLGTANVVNRYLGEMAIKNPKKMLHYIQYFIWYQSCTGLLQTTAISIYAIVFVSQTNLAYVVWIMTIYSCVQYPGYLGIFNNVLGSMQQFDKTIILSFLTGDVMGRLFEIGFVLLGNWYGTINPVIGRILGIAFGSLIGGMVKDFFAMWVSAWFFTRLVKSYNFRVRDCFRHDFDIKLVKETLIYGIKMGLPGLFWPIVGLVSFWLWLLYVPQYTTFSTLSGFAAGISGLATQGLNLGGSISEAYMNGKKKLTQYYIGQAWRFMGYLQGFLISVVLIILPILPRVLTFLGMDFYVLSVAFIIPQLVRNFQQPYNNISEDVIAQSNHPTFSMIMHFMEDAIALFCWLFFILWLQLPQKYGISMIIWIMPCAELPAILTKTIFNYIFIHKKVVPLKIPIWQSWGAPLVASLVLLLIGSIILNFMIIPLISIIGMIPSIIIFVCIAILSPIFIYSPLTVMLGGWDDGNVRIFQQVAKMSGPSKFLVVPMVKLIAYTAKHSPLHGRFAVDDTDARKEVTELMITRAAHMKDLKPTD